MMDMSPERFAQVRELFNELFGESPALRQERLDAVARTDAELSEAAGRLLERADLKENDERPVEISESFECGENIAGRYKVVRLLGEGGMGDVYLAERLDDTAQQVAFKLMRGSNPAASARFMLERRILARLGHPNIAHLIDVGLTNQHTPWLAMQYVDGVNIIEHCDRQRLDLRSRVALFIQVCRAVQFAHRSLVLHQDLKPSNILVDQEGIPKLLDFGIAKLLDESIGDKSQPLFLTPSYASPEQMRGESATTASDIYQLGLILVELLSGTSASEFRKSSLQASSEGMTRLSLSDVMSRISKADMEQRAWRRRTSGKRLIRVFANDLSFIVAAATADDPRQRYGTALAFGDDLERWINGQPIAVRRSTFSYRFGKVLRRNTGASALIGLFAIALVATSVLAVFRARQERDQRERAEAVLSFIREVFKQGDPENAKGAVVDTAELFQKAASKLQQRKDTGELTRGVILNEIANVLVALGHEDSAVSIARSATAALAPMKEAYPEEYLNSAETLVTSLGEMDLLDEQASLVKDALMVARKVPTGKRPWLGIFLTHRALSDEKQGRRDQARSELKEALDEFERGKGKESSDFVTTLYDGGSIALDSGDLEGALNWYEKAQEVQSTAADTTKKDQATLQEIIWRLRCQQGFTRESIEGLHAVVDQFEKNLGPSNNRTIMARVSLAVCYAAGGEYSKANSILKEAREGVDAGGTLIPAQRVFFNDSLARVDLYQFKFAQALEIAKENARVAADAPLRNWIHTRVAWLLGETLLQSGDPSSAAGVLRDVLNTRIDPSVASPISAEVHDSLGRCYLAEGKFEAAKIELSRAVEIWRAIVRSDSAQIVRSEIHELWADALATRELSRLQALSATRARLVSAIGREDAPQVWQFDMLVKNLGETYGLPTVDATRIQLSESRLKAIAGEGVIPAFVGLNSFSP